MASRNLITLCALAAWVAVAGGAAARQPPGHWIAITFAEGVVDRGHQAVWPGLTLARAGQRANAADDDQGMTLRGLRCTTLGATTPCHLFMAMLPVESRARFCAILPDRRPAPPSWPQSIDCPTQIAFRR